MVVGVVIGLKKVVFKKALGQGDMVIETVALMWDG